MSDDENRPQPYPPPASPPLHFDRFSFALIPETSTFVLRFFAYSTDGQLHEVGHHAGRLELAELLYNRLGKFMESAPPLEERH